MLFWADTELCANTKTITSLQSNDVSQVFVTLFFCPQMAKTETDEYSLKAWC